MYRNYNNNYHLIIIYMCISMCIKVKSITCVCVGGDFMAFNTWLASLYAQANFFRISPPFPSESWFRYVKPEILPHYSDVNSS